MATFAPMEARMAGRDSLATRKPPGQRPRSQGACHI